MAKNRIATGRQCALSLGTCRLPRILVGHTNPHPPMSTELSPRVERFFLLTLAGIQFSHVLDFVIMMPLGPILMAALGIGTHEFGLLVASYSFCAALSVF